jgi:uncharacterized protein YjbI with pentapeptide repeats
MTTPPISPTAEAPTTPTPQQLAEIVRLHRDWLYGRDGGRRAVLSGADLRDADLRGAVLRRAVLRGAVLRGAVLSGAVLRGAVLRDDTVLTDGVVWREYVTELVPALLTAGGRALEEVATPEVWACHQWGRDGEPLGCPIATAFGVRSLSEVPPLYRAPANLFIQLFDAQLIPLEAVLRQVDVQSSEEGAP